ncbi:MAG TPA: prolyl oligopeptidase family serine peptidase, partial [Candidatus Polarisedimenticolia bacterium]|nr:prolyl oligopeptidase family serine peptidase [Candidatus Polarisedimenticolia bacterium]
MPLARRLALSSLAAVLCAVPLPAAAAQPSGAVPAEPHGLGVRDMIAMERLADPQLSPDGKSVVFSRRVYDWDTNSTSISLWLIPMAGGEPRRLTAGKSKDTSPRWSPDGKSLVFVTDRGDTSQIWTIDPTGGEAAPLVRFPVDVDNPQWSPDGKRLAFTAEVYPDCADLQCTADRDKKKGSEPVKATLFEHLPIRHWDTWEDGKRSHIFVWRPGAPEAPVDIMKGLDADAPPKPFGGAEEFAWSPDGRSIAFTAKVRKDEAWSTDQDIYLASSDGAGTLRGLSEANEAQDSNPAFSPDGKTLAWLAMTRPGFEADRQRVVLHDLASGKTRAVTEGWDRSAASLAWAPDGRRLYVTADETGRVKVFSLTLPEGGAGEARPTVVAGDGHNASVDVGRDRLVFLHDTTISPAEVWSARLDGSEAHPLTRVNASRLASLRMNPAEEFWFEGAGGDKVHGWLVRPAGAVAGKKYPVAFLIHGGPQGAWGDSWSYRWNAELFAANGYVVVMINPRGSIGYGQRFIDDING